MLRRTILLLGLLYATPAAALDIEPPRWPSSSADQIVLMASAAMTAAVKYCDFNVDERQYEIFIGALPRSFVAQALTSGEWGAYMGQVRQAFAQDPEKECADVWSIYGQGGMLRNMLKKR